MGLVMVFSRLPIIRIHLVYKNRFNFSFSLSFFLFDSLVLFHSQNIRFDIHSFRFCFPIWFRKFSGYGLVYNLFSVVSFSKCLVSHTPTFCWFCRFVCLFFGLRESSQFVRSQSQFYIFSFVLTQKVFWFFVRICCSFSSFKKSR